MDSAFVHLGRSNRLEGYMGLAMIGDATYRLSDDYLHVDVPLMEAFNPSTEELVALDAIKGNMRLKLLPACTVKPKQGYRVQVDVHPSLLDVADISHLTTIDPVGEGEEQAQPYVFATFRKGADLSKLPYLVRLRVIA